MFHLANTYFPTMFLIFVVIITLFIEESNFDTNVMVLTSGCVHRARLMSETMAL